VFNLLVISANRLCWSVCLSVCPSKTRPLSAGHRFE